MMSARRRARLCNTSPERGGRPPSEVRRSGGVNHVALGPGREQARPLLTTSIVIYGTLALLALAVPRGLVSWSRNFEPNAAQAALLRTAQALQSFSQRLEADWPYRRGRELFLNATGKREE